MSIADRYRDKEREIIASFITIPIEKRKTILGLLEKLLDRAAQPESNEFVSGVRAEVIDNILTKYEDDEKLDYMDVFGGLYEEPWTIKDAARILGVTEITVRRYIKTGKLKASKPVRKYLIDYRDLKKFREQVQPL